MIHHSIRFVLFGVVVVAASVETAPAADAQCTTCATPTVAYYQPTTVYQPVATQQVYAGWYPGRFFDRQRMRRWGVTTATVPYTAAYAPYTVAYAPTSYTAAYRPYVTAYAPLERTSYYSVARPVVMSAVVSSCGTCGCDPCGCAQPACDVCSSCSAGVSQAVYGASTGCSSCATGPGVSTFSPRTPQPSLKPAEAIPEKFRYESLHQESNGDPSPEADASTYFEAPKLFSPQDRSASRPTVEVRNAVYSQPITHHAASHAPVSKTDAHGWSAVTPNR